MAKKLVEEIKIPTLKRTLAEINKKAQKQIIGNVPEMPNLTSGWIPTGITSLDTILGGGIPKGKISEVFGQTSVGKSLIALLIIKQAQALGLSCIYIDTENTFNVAWAQQLGVDTDKLILAQLSIAEDVVALIVSLLEANPGLIVVDSIAETVARQELEDGAEKPSMALKARLFSKALNIINATKQDTTLLFINQLRATLTMYGPKFYSTSGNSLPYYCSLRLEVKKIENIYENNQKTKEIIGQIIACKTTKNKSFIPQKTTSFKYIYANCSIQ